ncbi:DUF1003 domain-containing protein [Kitasatospora sp. GP82]|uniref:DUF1003 domain-containing protein n=1 Tax=Kitasatospora sp. GP82 TaxID=3035089 RepID=UPI002476EFC4|nr:DUF1003 domain-containing protein [Kitasatospora sp. GP82]MDH6123452.1 putative membrane protein [Kitasatospora sp. GP82]
MATTLQDTISVSPATAHPQVPHPHESLNNRLGDRISSMFGSMTTFWILVAWQLGWMTLATAGAPLLSKDPYPFTFCLFLSNLLQLWALPVLGNTQNRADTKRNAKADADHIALTYIAGLADSIALKVGATVPAQPAPTGKATL